MNETQDKEFGFLKGDLKAPIDSLECQLWKETHPNCDGCEHEKACKEYLMRIFRYTTMVLSERHEEDRPFLERLADSLDEEGHKS